MSMPPSLNDKNYAAEGKKAAGMGAKGVSYLASTFSFVENKWLAENGAPEARSLHRQAMKEEMGKAMAFSKAKYVKREGTPGNYRYTYEDASGKTRSTPSRGAEAAGSEGKLRELQDKATKLKEQFQDAPKDEHGKREKLMNELRDVSLSLADMAKKQGDTQKAERYKYQADRAGVAAKNEQDAARGGVADQQTAETRAKLDEARKNARTLARNLKAGNATAQDVERAFVGLSGPAMKLRMKQIVTSEEMGKKIADIAYDAGLTPHAKAARDVAREMRGKKAEKSMSGIDELNEYIQKSTQTAARPEGPREVNAAEYLAKAMPTHEPSFGTGEAQGGPLTDSRNYGVGEPADPKTGGGPTAVPTTGGQVKLSEDDENVEEQLQEGDPNKKPLAQAAKSMYAMGSRLAVEEHHKAQHQAWVQRKLNPEDVPVTGMPIQKSRPEVVRKSLDDHCADLVEKSMDPYYQSNGISSRVGHRDSPAHLAKSCGDCSNVYSAILTACPACGCGSQLQKSHAHGGGVVEEESRRSPHLQGKRVERDVKI